MNGFSLSLSLSVSCLVCKLCYDYIRTKIGKRLRKKTSDLELICVYNEMNVDLLSFVLILFLSLSLVLGLFHILMRELILKKSSI